MAQIKGGVRRVLYAPDMTVTPALVKEILNLLKEGTGIEPVEKTEEFADERPRSAGKGYRIRVRTADLAALTDLKAAEENGTLMDFMFLSLAEPVVIEDCEDAWNESVDPDVTSEVDPADKKSGVNSVKLTVAALAAAGDILATEAVGPLDLTTKKGMLVWFKSSVALNAGDLQILLDNSASCASPEAALDLPAANADEWTLGLLTFPNPALLAAVISVGVKMVVDKGAFVLRLDELIALPPNYHIKKVHPAVEDDPKAGAAYGAKRISGLAWGEKESDVIAVTT